MKGKKNHYTCDCSVLRVLSVWDLKHKINKATNNREVIERGKSKKYLQLLSLLLLLSYLVFIAVHGEGMWPGKQTRGAGKRIPSKSKYHRGLKFAPKET